MALIPQSRMGDVAVVPQARVGDVAVVPQSRMSEVAVVLMGAHSRMGELSMDLNAAGRERDGDVNAPAAVDQLAAGHRLRADARDPCRLAGRVRCVRELRCARPGWRHCYYGREYGTGAGRAAHTFD